MNVELLTKEDIKSLKTELIEEIKTLLNPNLEKKEWLKSSDVIKVLNSNKKNAA